jgi:hypothetical protein
LNRPQAVERFRQRFLRTALICGIGLSTPGWAFAQTVPPPSAAAAAPSAFSQRDGSHDFDFLIGDWKAHLHRMVDRESGVTTSDPRTGTWVEYDGICNDKKVLDTNSNFEQFDVQASRTRLLFRGKRFGCTIRHCTGGAFMGSTLIRASWVFRHSLIWNNPFRPMAVRAGP